MNKMRAIGRVVKAAFSNVKLCDVRVVIGWHRGGHPKRAVYTAIAAVRPSRYLKCCRHSGGYTNTFLTFHRRSVGWLGF